jgi:hypothetical protein
VLRRTFATNAQGHGNAKDVQTHLRHTDIATTLGVYTQPIDECVRRLVNAVADDVMTAKIAESRAITTRVQCGGNGLTVFYGMAKPVRVPLIGPPRQP